MPAILAHVLTHLAVVVAATGTATAAPAAPQTSQATPPATNRVLAEALFREGRDLMEHDKVSEACAKFGESYRLDRALGTLLNLAVCHEKEGKTATAWSEFSDAAAEAATEKDERGAFAQKRATALGAELPRVQLVIAPPASSLASLELQLDKSRLGRDAWTSTIPLDPGEHEVTAVADKKKPYRATFVVPKGPGLTAVNVPPLDDLPKQVETIPPPDSGSGSKGGTSDGAAQRWVGYIGAGMGVAGIGLGTVFGLRAISLKKDRDGVCDPANVCSSQAGVERDGSARDAATLSTIAFAAGGALLVGGIVLVLTAPSSNSIHVGTSGRALIVGGTF